MIKKRSLTKIAGGLALLALIPACGFSGFTGFKSSSGVNGVTISGGIGASSRLFNQVNSIRAQRGFAALSDRQNGVMAVSISDLQVYVIYFNGTDAGTVQATVDSTTGAWSFSVPKGSQISAVVRDGTTGELVGPITFVDSTTKDMSGRSKESTMFSFKAGAALGNITLSEDGKFTVDATLPSIAAAANVVTVVPTDVLDFSGSWTLGSYTGTLPSGYSNVCAPGDMGCHGPQIGEPIYMVKLVGKKFSYAGGNCDTLKNTGVGPCDTTDGTVGADTIHAAQIWGGGTAIQDCNFKTGFDAKEARAFGHISIASSDLPTISGTGVSVPSALTFGRVVFTVPAGYGGDAGPNNLPWMKTAATSDYDIMSCANVQKIGSDSKKYNLNVCKGNLDGGHGGGVAYQAMGPGGCTDSAGKPVIIKDWSGMSGLSPACGAVDTHPAMATMKTQTCAYTGVSGSVASASSFQCVNTWGTFTDATATTPAAVGAIVVTFSKVTAGATCSGIVDDLQRYKCYANAYFKDGGGTKTGCSTEYRFNWQAQAAADFVSTDGSRDKPKSQYLTSIVTYSPDGQSFTLEDEQSEGVAVQVGASSISCRIARSTIIKGTRLSATQMVADLTQNSYLKDTNVAACVGEKNNSTANMGHGSELYQRLNSENGRFMFTLNK